MKTPEGLRYVEAIRTGEKLTIDCTITVKFDKLYCILAQESVDDQRAWFPAPPAEETPQEFLNRVISEYIEMGPL